MKRFLRTFLIIFAICCSIVGVFLLRNYLILNKIRKLQIDTWSKIENSNNFIYEDFSITSIGSTQGTKLYCKDGIYKQVFYDTVNKVNDIKYFDVNETEKERIFYEVERAFEFVEEESFKNEVKHYVFRFIKSKDNQYIISIYVKSSLRPNGTDYFYFNKETGMLEKWETVYGTTTYTITENVVTDDDIANQTIAIGLGRLTGEQVSNFNSKFEEFYGTNKSEDLERLLQYCIKNYKEYYDETVKVPTIKYITEENEMMLKHGSENQPAKEETEYYLGINEILENISSDKLYKVEFEYTQQSFDNIPLIEEIEIIEVE